MDEVSNEELLAMLEDIGNEDGDGSNRNEIIPAQEKSGPREQGGYGYEDGSRGGGDDVTEAQVIECVIQSLLAMEEAWQSAKYRAASVAPDTIGAILEAYQVLLHVSALLVLLFSPASISLLRRDLNDE